MMNKVSYVILACYPDKGMKTHGSKSLMLFNNKKLLDHQINTIQSFNKNNKDYEIIIVSSFDTLKLQKSFNNIKVIDCIEYNPVYTGCINSKYKNLLYIDYGCVFNQRTLNSIKFNHSSVLCYSNNKKSPLDIGCISDEFSNLVNMFFDLPNNKFCNIFYINEHSSNKIRSNSKYNTKNLLYFEIINMLIAADEIFKISTTNHNDFIYFNKMRQKNAISKFYK